MSYEVWLFAPTYACISTKLSLYLVNKALSLHNILVFSFHAYRTRQMSMNGGTKNNKSELNADFTHTFPTEIQLFIFYSSFMIESLCGVNVFSSRP